MSDREVHRPRRPPEARPKPRFDWLVARSVSDLPPGARRRRLAPVEAAAERLQLGPERPTLVSSAHGAIDSLLLAIPKDAARDPTASSLYQGLTSQLPRSTELRILTHGSTVDLVRSWPDVVGRGDRAVVVPVRDHVAFSVWVEDPFAAVSDTASDDTWLVEPFEFSRYADALLADHAAAGTELKFSSSALYFQGGNMLVGDEFFLLGEDYPNHMSEHYVPDIVTVPEGVDKETFIRDLYRHHLDRERDVLYVGDDRELPREQNVLFSFENDTWVEQHYAGNVEGTRQPIFHIDMFVTLAGRGESGKYRLLVGDPRMAAELLGQPLPDNALADSFDRIAEKLRAQGFEVGRNPLPLTYWVHRVPADHFASSEPHITQGLRDRGLEEVDLLRWYYATSNNALVQISEEEGNVVWLPTYGEGFEPTDRRNREIWQQELGFEVRLLGDFHPFALGQGAVHCLTKYLARR